MSAGQISHGNGGSRAASLLSKGSTNWSSPGEGTGISLDAAKPSPGFKGAEQYSGRYANSYDIAKFAARRGCEHGPAVFSTAAGPSASAGS